VLCLIFIAAFIMCVSERNSRRDNKTILSVAVGAVWKALSRWNAFDLLSNLKVLGYVLFFLIVLGTLRPDLIESASELASGKADAIKTHHNDTDLVRQLRRQVIIAAFHW
jgi:hypothetical protein